MALVTANQFRLQPDPGTLARSIQQGQSIRGQFDQRQQREQAQQSAQAATQQKQQLQQIQFVGQSAKQLRGLPIDQRQAAFESLQGNFEQLGIPIESLGTDFSDKTLDNAIASSEAFAPKVTKTTAQRDLEFKTSGLTDEQTRQALEIDLGLRPRAATSAAERIAVDPTKTAQVAKSQAEIEAAKETAKLSSQLKLKPEVEAAVIRSVGEAKETVKIAGDKRSNAIAFNVYESAISNLVTSLGGTTTGPGLGFIPAITANAQIANGAVAMMAPVLKQLFRGAGEGTFTDQDQKMLLALIPDRNTLPEARKSQLAAIDALVRAKLSLGEAPVEEPAQPAEEPEAFDAGLLEFMTPEEKALFNGS